MSKEYYSKKYFMERLSDFQLEEHKVKKSFSAAFKGKKVEYDVFLSHSTKDMALIKRIKDTLEIDFNISVYVDWDEDAGTPRYEIANVVKEAMDCSRSFLVVKTDNSDESSWVPWETGYFDKKDANKIGVLLVEDENSEFNINTFEHREFLKNYIILGPDDIIDFIESGSSYVESKAKRTIFDIPLVVIPEKMVRPHIND